MPLVLAGGLLALIALQEIRVGLAVLLLAIGLSPEFVFLGIPNFRYEDFIFPALFAVWLGRHVLTRERLAPNDLRTPLLMIVFVAATSSLLNHLYGQLDLTTSTLRLGKSVQYFLMFVLVLNTLRGRRDTTAFIALMLGAGTLVGLFGIVQWWLHGDAASFRLVGPSGETANILGGYSVFHICIALGLLARVEPAHRPWLLAFIGLMLVPLGLTLSRTSYVALFAGLATIWAVSRSSVFTGPVVLLALLALLLPDSITDRFGTILGVFSGDAPSSWEARVAGWRHFVPAAMERPILGHGVGSTELGAVDNEYVLRLYSVGVLGLGAFLWLVSRCVRTSYRLQKNEREDRWTGGFALGYLGGTVALLAHGLAATTFTTIRTAEPFFFATGILYVCWNSTRIREEPAEERPTLAELAKLHRARRSGGSPPR